MQITPKTRRNLLIKRIVWHPEGIFKCCSKFQLKIFRQGMLRFEAAVPSQSAVVQVSAEKRTSLKVSSCLEMVRCSL